MRSGEKKETYTLITGATGGLGSAFAHRLIRDGENLILTGRSEEKLRLLKEKLLCENGGRTCGFLPPICRTGIAGER